MLFHSNSLPYLQCSIRAAAAGGCLIADLFRDRRLMGTVAGPEVCLYSRSRFLRSCDILTTSEVSQLFQGINNGSGSPYLTFTVQAVCFVVVVFYLPGYPGKTSVTFLLSRLHWFPLSTYCHAHGKGRPLLFASVRAQPSSSAFMDVLQGGGWLPPAAVREFLEAFPAMSLHPSSPSYLLGCSLSHIFVVCLFSSSSVTTK